MKLFNVHFRWWCTLSMFVLVLVLLAWITNVPVQLRPDDVSAIRKILGVQEKPLVENFDGEIKVIRWAQAKVLNAAPGNDPIPNFFDREPLDLLKAQSGWCYDRSRTLDKVLAWLGFKTRHVYILFADRGAETTVIQFVMHAASYSQSHAVTEVKTSMGWLIVDSNDPWISLNRHGEPVSADKVYQRRTEFDQPPRWVDFPLWAIQGMYSRTGQFYKPYLPIPEFNWPDFLSSVLEF